jgi:proteasome accessory factor B
MVDRLERLTDLVLVLLHDQRPRSLREIAEEVPGYPPPGEARRQAFERDKRTLREEGILFVTEPIEGPDQFGYRIRAEDFYLPDLELEADEQTALNLAVAGIHFGDPSGRDALWRLGLAAPTGHQPLADLPALPALPVLWEAVHSRCRVTFGYRGGARTVDPAVLRFHGGWWYLVGHDLDRDAPRTFRVDRMEGRPSVGDPGSAQLPEAFDVTGALPEPWQLGEGEIVPVEVLVDAVVAPRVIHELGESAVTDRRADGSVVVRLEVSNTAALRSWVLELAERAEVLRPPALRDELVGWLEAVVAAGGN